MMVMNIVVSATPLYRVEDWLHDYLDGISEQRIDAAKYNDDRIGRCLDLLFDADRSSFMVDLAANAIRVHQLVIDQIHNDSTRITFIGVYEGADPKAVNITYGYNKDHRPDCKQIAFGLNTTADGHVPLSYQLYDGNQADVTTCGFTGTLKSTSNVRPGKAVLLRRSRHCKEVSSGLNQYYPRHLAVGMMADCLPFRPYSALP